MVNITAAARAASAAYALAIGRGANYSIPLPTIAAEVSSFFLPNYTSFSLGQISALQNRSTIEQGFIELYTKYREEGQPGTNVHMVKTKVRAVSNQSTLCWLMYCIEPTNGMEDWKWRNVYVFRLVEGGFANGQAGGWELAIGDQEHESYEAKFPNAC